MTGIEALLISSALAVNIFLTAEYEGSNLRIIRLKWVLLISLIFTAGQMISMGCGYLISTVPFFRMNRTEAIRSLCCVIAALIFFVTYLVVSFLRSGDLSRMILTGVGAGLMGLMIIIFKPYLASRFTVWGHVWEFADDQGYQQH